MARQLSHLSFEEWVEHIFGHPPGPPGALEWYWSPDADSWSDTPEVTLRYLTKLFEDPATILTRYSEDQIKQGLWFLTNSSAWDVLCVLWDETLPRSDRERGIRSMYSLFETFFARRCSQHLSHTDSSNHPVAGVSPLNGVCYMWWDNVSGFRPAAQDRVNAEDIGYLDEVFLETMHRILDLDSAACIESALHGLGHWCYRLPERVSQLISAFLDRHPKLPPALTEYALRAGLGGVP